MNECGAAALLAGFSFSQITTALPDSVSYTLEASYLLVAALALGLELCVIVTTTFCCMWGPGLALRGPDGTRSVHAAVESLKSEQVIIFSMFLGGLSCFFASNILLLWCYFEEWVALSASLFLGAFVLLVLYYSIALTLKLRVSDSEAVSGNIEALKAYEDIGDLDSSYREEPDQKTEFFFPTATPQVPATRSALRPRDTPERTSDG